MGSRPVSARTERWVNTLDRFLMLLDAATGSVGACTFVGHPARILYVVLVGIGVAVRLLRLLISAL